MNQHILDKLDFVSGIVPINLGSGQETSILELLTSLREAGLSLNGDGPPAGTTFEPEFDRLSLLTLMLPWGEAA